MRRQLPKNKQTNLLATSPTYPRTRWTHDLVEQDEILHKKPILRGYFVQILIGIPRKLSGVIDLQDLIEVRASWPEYLIYFYKKPFYTKTVLFHRQIHVFR